MMMMAHQNHHHPNSKSTIWPAVFNAGFIAMYIVLILSIKGVSGAVECEELPVEYCAFAVSSSGARCVLEKQIHSTNSDPVYKCQTSVIMAERRVEWIETDACLSACGLQRMTVGLSTDALLEGGFTTNFCFSAGCRTNCPNINDLYTKLVAEEGIYLPSLCEALKGKAPRKLVSDSIPAAKPLKHFDKLSTTTSTSNEAQELQVVGSTYNPPVPSPNPSSTQPTPLSSPPSASPTPAPTPSPSPSPSVSNNNYDYYINSGNVGAPPNTPPSPSPSLSKIPSPTPSLAPSTYPSNVPTPTLSPTLSPYPSNPNPTPTPSPSFGYDTYIGSTPSLAPSPSLSTSTLTPTPSPSFGYDTYVGSTPSLAPSPSLPTPTPTLAPSANTFDYITYNTPSPSPSSLDYITSSTTPTLAPSISPSSQSPTPVPSNAYDYNYFYNSAPPSNPPSPSSIPVVA